MQGVSLTTQDDWLVEFKDKVVSALRSKHEGPVPSVWIEFTDGSKYEVFVRAGVYFEGCMINTLRKAQPITDVLCVSDGADTYLEVAASTFPLFLLLAVNKKIPEGDFPFWLEKREPADG